MCALGKTEKSSPSTVEIDDERGGGWLDLSWAAHGTPAQGGGCRSLATARLPGVHVATPLRDLCVELHTIPDTRHTKQLDQLHT